MCGIIGYIGRREALPIVLEGLSRMEYRGYDSAGFVILNSGTATRVRASGKIALLKERAKTGKLQGVLGIGHTRWATHGAPTEANAHPHTDCTESFFVAHNGIIENYLELKEELKKKKHHFTSDTDTEIIPHLIEEAYRGDIKEAVVSALKKLRGAFGVVVLSRRDSGVLLAARFGSPLILGIGKEEVVVASDVTAILPVTNSAIYLDDGDLVTIKDNRYEITDFRNGSGKLKRTTTTIEWSQKAAELGGFPHFMLKEIFEQSESLQNTMRGRLVQSEGTVKFGGLETLEARIRSLKRVIIVGMGTARLTGLIGEYAIEELAGISAKVEFGSEFAYRSAATDEHTGLIAISQSGETADTLNAIKEAKRRGMLTLGIVNVIGSSIARSVDGGIYNHIGPEIAVASTKASTSEVLLLIMLALYLGRMRGLSKSEGEAVIKEMKKLPAAVETLLKSANKIKALAKKYKKAEHMLILGRKYHTATAMEGALKLKEISYIHAEGYNAAEMKHGPIALIDKDFPSIVVAPQDSTYEKNKSHIEELKARKGPVIALTTEGNTELRNIVDEVLYVPKTLELLAPILYFIPLQLLAYYSATLRGCDIDKPRNLAKSVTVE